MANEMGTLISVAQSCGCALIVFIETLVKGWIRAWGIISCCLYITPLGIAQYWSSSKTETEFNPRKAESHLTIFSWAHYSFHFVNVFV